MTTAPITHLDVTNQLKKIKTDIHRTYNISYNDEVLRKLDHICDEWTYRTTRENLQRLHNIQMALHNDYGVDLDSSENNSITDMVDVVKKFQL